MNNEKKDNPAGKVSPGSKNILPSKKVKSAEVLLQQPAGPVGFKSKLLFCKDTSGELRINKILLQIIQQTFTPLTLFPVIYFSSNLKKIYRHQSFMKNKSLGNQGLVTSSIGLGCMGMSEFYGESNDAESIKTIHRAFELGITFFDTADMYGPFKNEVLVGKAIAPFRNEITLATKFGLVRNPENPQARGFNGRPGYVNSACEASLKRLNVEVIDLYYLHRKDPDTPIEETVGAMGELVKEGKVKAIGLSEVNIETLLKANEVYPITALQSEYSLWSREPEEEIIPACKEMNIAFVAYSPLGRGFLTGQIKNFDDFGQGDYRRMSPRFQGENFNKNLELVKKIETIASEKGCTPSQLALAWVLAQGDFIFPIPGTKKIKYVEENAAATEVELSPEDLKQINKAFPENAAAGLRYPEAMMKSVNQ